MVSVERVQPGMGRAVERRAAAGRDHAPLPGATHHVPRTPQRRGRRPDAASVHPLAHHRHRHHRRRQHRTSPHRELQGVAHCPTRPEEQASRQEHPAAPAADDPHLPRAAHRMGRARRSGPEPDPARRHPAPLRTDPEVPHRPTSCRVHGRRPHPSRRPLPARRPGPGPHRPTRLRALRTGCRCRHPHRHRRLLAARPGRQAPQRPHDPPPPRSRRLVRGVDRHQQRAHSPGPTAARRSPRPDRPAHRAPHHRPHRRHRRHRRHAPPPLETHPRHPGHQPRHAPRSHRSVTAPSR